MNQGVPYAMTLSKQVASVAVCSLTTFLVNIDNTAYQVASPTIIRELKIFPEATIWIIGAFTLTLATLELYTGWLGDKLGRKRLLIFGLCIYIIGSLLVTISNNLVFLLSGRIISGIGGAALVPMGLAILRDISTSSSQLHKFTSYWGISVGMGLALGPLIGGAFTEFFSWRSLPASTALFGAAFAIAAAKLLPTAKLRTSSIRYDLAGMGLLTIAAALLTFVVIAESTLSLLGIISLISISITALLSVLARYRISNRDPLPSPGDRGPLFLPAILAALVNYLAFGCSIFVISVGLLQNEGGVDPAKTGVFMLPIAMGYSIGSRAAPMLIARWGLPTSFVAPAVIGVITMAVTMASVTSTHLNYNVLVIGLLLGLVVGALNAPTNSLAMSQVNQLHAGLSGAYASTSRQVGQSLGVAFGGIAVFYSSTAGGWLGALWVPSLLCFIIVGVIGIFTLGRSVR